MAVVRGVFVNIILKHAPSLFFKIIFHVLFFTPSRCCLRHFIPEVVKASSEPVLWFLKYNLLKIDIGTKKKERTRDRNIKN